QPASRVALTAALTDRHTVSLEHYEHVLGIDRSLHNGQLRGDKAPGQPFLAVPAYATARVVGAQSASVLRVRGNLTLWWVTLWTAAIPGVLLLVLLFREASRRLRTRAAVGMAVALFAGSQLLLYSTSLYGHVLAALTAFSCWL